MGAHGASHDPGPQRQASDQPWVGGNVHEVNLSLFSKDTALRAQALAIVSRSSQTIDCEDVLYKALSNSAAMFKFQRLRSDSICHRRQHAGH